jgi:hypothetical protein
MKLAAFLEKKMPAEYKARKWGELERMKMPDETFRWLCKKHRAELDRKLGV